MPRFVVEGAWDNGNEGSPITIDWVIAKNADAAAAKVSLIRNSVDAWTVDRVMAFKEYIAELEEEYPTGNRRRLTVNFLIHRLTTITDDEVRSNWAKTVENLNGRLKERRNK